MKTLTRCPVLTWMLAVWLMAYAACVPAQDAPATFGKEQIDQMVAPVALYPDALLSQILMASTYPADVADAVAWSRAHPGAKGDDAVKQVASERWDPSVQSLVAFPQVLLQMQAQPDWVRNLGDAFLAQPEDVMASVQRLRAQAQKAGHLKTNEQQTVVVQSSGPSTVIEIQPANPQVVYVPTYNPTVVYGTWAYPAYPPPYFPPPPGYYHPVATGLAAGLAFGTGVAIANSLWGGFDWGHNDVHIDVNRYNNINVNNRISGSGNVNWNHNPANRRGTPYRDTASRQRYGQGVPGAQQRDAFRGHDASVNADRQRAMQSFDQHTGNGAAASARRPGAAGGGENRSLSRPEGGANRANAFSGVRQPSNTPAQMQRGQNSMRNASAGRPSAPARPVNRPVPARGGMHFGRPE